ncbi:MAG: hypothetical protein AABX78_03095 [Nanoarchaeota archaeon]
MPSRIKKARSAYSKKDISIAKQAHSKESIERQIKHKEHDESAGQYLGVGG